MNWKDIPQFTSCGDFWTEVPLEYIERQLESDRADYNLELNPDFQRGNVWTEAQQIAYVEYFLKGGMSAREVYFNCPNHSHARASLPEGERQDIFNMVCVDGLQRLTALLRFLHNEIPAFGCLYKDFEGRPRYMKYSLIFRINNLLTRKEVLKWYIELNTGGTVHSDEEIARVEKLYQEALDAEKGR